MHTDSKTELPSHFLHLYDIKLYIKIESVIDSLVHLTRMYSRHIRMSFKQEMETELYAKPSIKIHGNPIMQWFPK